MQKRAVAITALLFFWAGFVSSISFMEAWLKFQAPGVTLPVGLSIGKLIFTALNRVEWVFLLLVLLFSLPRFKQMKRNFFYLLTGVAVLLFLQTIWFLPELTNRAEMIIAGDLPGESGVHLLFGIAEVLKVALLLIAGYFSGRLKTTKQLK